MLSFFMQDSFKDFKYVVQDSFSSKIRHNILMVSVNFISKLFRYILGGSSNLIFLMSRMPWVLWEKILSQLFLTSPLEY